MFSFVQLFATLWTVNYHAFLSMRFFRQEYWSGLPCPCPGDLPNPGIESTSSAAPALQADSLPTEPLGKSTFLKTYFKLYNPCGHHHSYSALLLFFESNHTPYVNEET